MSDAIDADELLQLPIFKGVSPTFLEKNRGAVTKRLVKQGEIVCREGEFGSTAFYIVDGTVDIFIATPIKHVKQQATSDTWFSRIRSVLVDRREHTRAEETARRFIPIDAPVDLPYDRPTAQLGAGDLFGEMTCLNFYPRSATVRAATDCTVIEMLRNVLEMLQRNKAFKAQLDESYRKRALGNHLRGVALLGELPAEFLDYLSDRVTLISYAPGQVICGQGDRADAFYLVRLGFVKVSESHPGGDLVLGYIPRGGYFGEIGLLGAGIRTATCTALDHVEVVQITAEDFALMTERFADVRARITAVAQERIAQNTQRTSAISSSSLNEFLAQGLLEARSLLVLDLEKCTRCDECVRACADAHDGVTRLVRDGLRFDKYLVATSCRQCLDPLCMVGCPVGSIRRRNSLEVIIEDWCIGCGLCARNCPYGNITLHPFALPASDASAAASPARAEPGHAAAAHLERAAAPAVRNKATACDLCLGYKEPSCVYACPHDAAHRIEPLVFFAPGTPAARATPTLASGVDHTSK
jgi:CRP-like cAMP-binding protein